MGALLEQLVRGEADGVELSGDVTAGLLGADIGTDDWIAGVALSAAKGDGPFSLTSNRPSNRSSGTVDSSLTSVHPTRKFRQPIGSHCGPSAAMAPGT